MPLQNRVNPNGGIEHNPARGTFMGNRGVLHNSNREVTRPFKTKAWITCLLEFRGRQRELMTPGLYTELFFLDEVTAFAAGHRPCAECRRARYNQFRDAWSTANDWKGKSKIRTPEIDEVLHQERIDAHQKVTWTASLSDLPHGTLFQIGEDTHAVCDGRVLDWSFDGYRKVKREDLPDTVEVLTPRSVVRAFSVGFRPEFHSTAESRVVEGVGVPF